MTTWVGGHPNHLVTELYRALWFVALWNRAMTIIPTPAVIVLVGPSGSGKSVWADERVGASHVVSSDRLRALVGEGEDDQSASVDAFALLNEAIRRRVARRLTTVIDTLGFDADNRAAWRALARENGMPCVCVAFDTPPAICRQQNRERARSVPVKVLDQQLKTYASIRDTLEHEGFDLVVTASADLRVVPARLATAAPLAALQATKPVGLRFGLQIPSFTWPGGPAEIGPHLRAVAKAAEEAGFESLWVMDHFRQIPMFGAKWLDMMESWTTLSHIAAVTDHIRIGTMVTGITYRNVAHLGKIVATIDVLSGGRAICGLGAAWFAEEHRAYGLPFPAAKERYELLEDALRLLPLLWGPGSPAFHGNVLHVPEALCYPRPLQEHLPILVGGSGERRTLALVAQYADACNIIGDADTVQRKIEVLHRHCLFFDRDPQEIEVTQLSTTLVGRNTLEVGELVETYRPKRTSVSRFAATVNAGTVVDQVGRFRRLADAGVQTAVVSLPDIADLASIERFASIVSAFRP
jgi:F420-dependent oxidoreductase-like protein